MAMAKGVFSLYSLQYHGISFSSEYITANLSLSTLYFITLGSFSLDSRRKAKVFLSSSLLHHEIIKS